MSRANEVFRFTISLMVTAGVLLLAVYLFAIVLKSVQPEYAKYLYAGIIASIGIVIALFLNRFVKTELSHNRFINARKSGILFFVNVLIYFVLSVAILASMGINVSSVILGGVFLSVVLALAVQGVLGNMVSGLLVIFAKPFVIGDRILVLSWNSSSPLVTLQYSIFFPKYFSMDAMYSQGVTGKVEDISLNYTKLREDDGNVVKLPNSIVSNGAFLFPDNERRIVIRYEVPKALNPDLVFSQTDELLSRFQESISEKRIFIDETTLNTYVMLLIIDLLRDGMKTIRTDIIGYLKQNLETYRIKVSVI